MALTYGIDVHGTLANRTPEGGLKPTDRFALLEPLMRAWMKKGETVYIVSGPPTEEIEAEVTSLGLQEGVHYTECLSVVDFLQTRESVPMWQDDRGWWSDHVDWNKAKAKIAFQYGIDIIIDDMADYREAMPEATDFILVVNAT